MNFDIDIFISYAHIDNDAQPLSDASPEQRWQQRLDAACQMANRNLTPDEWVLVFGSGTAYHETCPDASTLDLL